MALSEKMRGFADNMQEGAKNSSVSFVQFALRFITGLVIGFTLALIGQEMVGYGGFSLLFTTVVILGLFLRISRFWRIAHILIFDLICILVAQLLRMYILLAP